MSLKAALIDKDEEIAKFKTSYEEMTVEFQKMTMEMENLRMESEKVYQVMHCF